VPPCLLVQPKAWDMSMRKNKMSTSRFLLKMTLAIVLAFSFVPATKHSQADEIQGLIQALEDKNVNIRRRAIRALEKAGPSAVEPLIAALKSEKSRARAGAAEALGRIGDVRAVEPLIAALEDKIANVRSWAAKALGEIKDFRAVEPLIEALQDESTHVRSWAAEALGEIKDPRAVEPLIGALQDENADVRNSAAKALVEIQLAT
jgi:HEAT repeat protein